MNEELKNAENADLEDMVFRMELKFSEITEIFDTQYIATSSTGYTLPPGIYEVSNNNLKIKSLLPDDVKVDKAKYDIGLKSNLTVNRSITFTKKSFLYTILCFKESRSGVLGDFDGLIVLFPGSYKSEKPINKSGIDKIHSKCNFINVSIINGVREANLYSCAIDKPSGHKIYKEVRIKLFRKKKKLFCLV